MSWVVIVSVHRRLLFGLFPNRIDSDAMRRDAGLGQWKIRFPRLNLRRALSKGLGISPTMFDLL